MAKGGKRAGAGRKRGLASIKAEETRNYLLKTIADEYEPIVKAQLEAAKGMWVEELDSTGLRIRVYRRPPELKTGEYLINQSAGKPTETVKISGEIIKRVILADE